MPFRVRKPYPKVSTGVTFFPHLRTLTSSCLPRLSHSNFATIRRESLREWDNQPNTFRVTKQSGLDLEKKPRSSGRGGAFFLTSLSIELIDGVLSAVA